VLDESHTTIARPTFLVIVTHDILIVGIRLSAEVSLDKVPRFFGSEAEENVDLVDIARVQSDWVAYFRSRVLELQEIVGHRRRTRHLASALQAENEQIEHKTIVLHKKVRCTPIVKRNSCGIYLENECRELKATDQTITVNVTHILVRKHDVVLRCTIVGLQAPVSDSLLIATKQPRLTKL
jgi:hypothetical protein